MNAKEIKVLLIIVVAQFLCTSLWFAGNAVLPQLGTSLSLSISDMGWMTSSVQFGFIVGTLFYALLTIADRFNASSVFLTSALLGAVANGFISYQSSYVGILAFRFLTGFFLAGIYPVGMKIASDHFEKGLGKALSFLVGALVLGTALPHLIASLNSTLDWKFVLFATSALSLAGGLMIKIFVGEGPFKKHVQKPRFTSMVAVFKNKKFRAASFGYFGHMWELYAFWAFVPLALKSQGHLRLDTTELISMQSFIVIGLGATACFLGGFLSEKYGTSRIANWFLALSGFCCIISPIAFELNRDLFLGFFIFWGLVVIADSPLFSTLVAQNAKPEIKGTALTLVTCIGFAITIVSIQLVGFLSQLIEEKFIFVVLAIGPIFGLLSMRK